MSDSAIPPGPAALQRLEPGAGDYWRLLKPRVMSLVIFTALVGLVIAPANPHPVIAFAAILCVAIGAGASGALNMWWDADIDALMERTANRPIPAGHVTPQEALGFGLALSVLSVAMLGLFANYVAAGLLAFTIFFYAVIYSMWLKRRTPQNIVIGGAAGAFPPMIGWAIATGGIAPESIILFLLIFLWTPPHFWALALWRRPDYARVSVPMLPVVAGEAETRRQIWLYAVALTVVSFAPLATPVGGPLYLVVALYLNVRWLRLARMVGRRSEAAAQADSHRAEKQLFGLSLVYLFGLFAALLIEAMLRSGLDAFGYAWPHFAGGF